MQMEIGTRVSDWKSALRDPRPSNTLMFVRTRDTLRGLQGGTEETKIELIQEVKWSENVLKSEKKNKE